METNIINMPAFDPGRAQIFQNYLIMRMETKNKEIEELRS
jgi:hypothetical protein